MKGKVSKMKRILTIAMAAAIMTAALTGCGSSGFSADSEINVISRESGSGTRGAFIELFGIEEKDADGNKVDYTKADAVTSSSTGVVLTTVASDANAIGYISLGALNDTVKALKIDGAEATVANIKNGIYTISRPFNIVTKDGLSDVAQDFIAFILSAEGQAVVEENDYIPLDGAAAYSGTKPSGKVTVGGSSSVTPLMEKLKEAYMKVNPNATIEVSQSDSSSGIKNAINGVCDIGMASRELKESEAAEAITTTVIATDGIAVVVNPGNTLDGLTAAQVKAIYTGEALKWTDVGAE